MGKIWGGHFHFRCQIDRPPARSSVSWAQAQKERVPSRELSHYKPPYQVSWLLSHNFFKALIFCINIFVMNLVCK